MDFYTMFITLILVMDPLGNIPVFLSILKEFDTPSQIRIILRESAIAFVVLLFFLFFGSHVLTSFHINMPALGIAGGIILFMISLRMIFPVEGSGSNQEDQFNEPLIVPLAIPLTAGPSAITVVMLLASQRPTHTAYSFLALLLASVVFAAIMICSRFLMRILGQRVLIAFERLMGMLLTTLAVQMFLNGLFTYLHQTKI